MMKKLAKKFKGQFESFKNNAEKDIIFSAPTEKEKKAHDKKIGKRLDKK